ncbi:MAG: hypothetical protein AVDCRST_MAG73-2857, partial [uncultured Thermomicrobiales bacterium]
GEFGCAAVRPGGPRAGQRKRQPRRLGGGPGHARRRDGRRVRGRLPRQSERGPKPQAGDGRLRAGGRPARGPQSGPDAGRAQPAPDRTGPVSDVHRRRARRARHRRCRGDHRRTVDRAGAGGGPGQVGRDRRQADRAADADRSGDHRRHRRPDRRPTDRRQRRQPAPPASGTARRLGV